MENSYLSHHGILGQKWGVRRYQNEDGSLTPEGRERYGNLNKGEREYVIDNNTFTRFSDKRERSVRNSSYVLSTKYDYRHYKEDAEDYKLGNKGKELYEITIKRHGNAKVAEASTTISDLMTELSKKDTKTREEQKALKTYRRLDKAGFFNEKLSVNDRYDVLLNTLSPKGIEHVDYLLKKATNKVGDKEDYAQKKRNAFAEQAHNQVYANRDAFAAKYRDKGYSMIVDPEDYIYNYERPYIIVDKRKFTVSSTKKLKHSEGGLDMTYDELVHSIFSESPEDTDLEHHGILGMKWGIRRYQNEDGSLTPAGRERYQKGLAKEVRDEWRKSRGRYGSIAKTEVYKKVKASAKDSADKYLDDRRKLVKKQKEIWDKAKTDPELRKDLAKSAMEYDFYEAPNDQARRQVEKYWNSSEWLDKDDEETFYKVMDAYDGDKELNELELKTLESQENFNRDTRKYTEELLGMYGNEPLNDVTSLSYMVGASVRGDLINVALDSKLYEENFKHSLEDDHLEHHGILGQKWGKKNGPPYPLDENDHSAAEKKLNKFTPSGVVAKYKDHKKKVQRQKALKKARATKAANAEAKKAAEEHEAAKQKALRSANASEIMKYRDELTDAEMRDAVARIGWDETLRKKAKEQNPGKIEKAVKIVDKYGTMAGKIGDATGNFTKMYNNIAKVLNTFTDSDWPTIEDSKKNNQNGSDKKPESSKPSGNKNNRDKKNFDKVIREATRILGNAAKKVDEEESQKEAKSGAKGVKGEKWEKRDWTVDDKSDTSSSSTSSAPKKETVIDAEFKDVTPERAEEVGRLAVERYLQLEDKRKG